MAAEIILRYLRFGWNWGYSILLGGGRALRNLKITYIDATMNDTILAARNLKVRKTDGQNEINVNEKREIDRDGKKDGVRA